MYLARRRGGGYLARKEQRKKKIPGEKENGKKT